MSTDKFDVCLDFRFHAHELPGVGHHSQRWQILAAFLKTSEGRVERLMEHRNGILMLVSVPFQPNTGAVYLYHEPTHSFYWVQFGNRQDDLSGREFDEFLGAYQLERYISENTLPCSKPRSHRNRARRNRARFIHRSKGAPTAAVSAALLAGHIPTAPPPPTKVIPAAGQISLQ